MSRRSVLRRFDAAFAAHRDGRPAEALAAYDAILSIDRGHAPSLHYSALLLHAAGRADDALARIERSLVIDGRVPDAWTNAGLLYAASGRPADAARAYERALALEPDLGTALLNLSALRLEEGEAGAAAAVARRAIAASARPSGPAVGRSWIALAVALHADGQVDAALDALDRAEAPGSGDVRPDDAITVAGLRAQWLAAAGRIDEARGMLDGAIGRTGDASLALLRARLAEAAGDEVAAVADYRRVLAVPALADAALSELVYLRKRRVLWDGLADDQARFRRAVDDAARSGRASELTPFSFLSDPSTRAEQRRAAEAWSRRYGPPAPRSARAPSAGRLRIGYLSADLHAHATGVLAAGLFEAHDRSAFDIVAFSTGPDDGSPLRRRLESAFDRFVDARGWSAARIAAAIDATGIDILVDLKGHTEHAATAVLACRPAPIVVSYLGYPGTTGAPFVDYLIGDAIVTPLDDAADYSETLVLLPGSYQVNDDRRPLGEAPSRAALGLPGDAPVLCCFNQPYKIGPDVLDAWAAILAAVPRAVLWLLTQSDDDALRRRVVAAAVARGIDAGRVVFAATRAQADYLALYTRADLFLDTWPYNAHTTASDALWAGCPVLTTRGATFAGRVAASVVTAGEFEEGVAPDRAAYVARAIEWAGDRATLDTLRVRLEGSRRSSPLFDTRRTARALEAAYRAMADRHPDPERTPIVVADPGPSRR